MRPDHIAASYTNSALELIGYSETVAERVFLYRPVDGIVPLDRTARSETDDKRKDQCRQRDNPGCFTAYEYMNRHQHHRHEPGNDEDIGHSVHAGIDTHRNTHCNQVHVVVYRRSQCCCSLSLSERAL